MRNTGKRLLALILSAIMVISAVPNEAFAYMAPKEEKLSIVGKDGTPIEEEESWETTFPYGAFAFEHASISSAEGEDSIVKVYRLGGTAGRATAYITYEPVLTQSEEGTAIYDYAISSDDMEINVEEPQPAAKYQPIGKAPDPKASAADVTAVPDEKGYTLNLSVPAEVYQWQILNDGVWENILDATAATVPADKEFIDGGTYDYRCLYTEKAVQYCSVSLRGEAYLPPTEEVLPPMPDDINFSADPVYTPLDMKSAAEGAFAGWAFELVFADGEWVKEIHLSALTDALPEAQESATFTIRDCEGGQVLESANALLMSIRDINEPEPSTLGFTVSEVSVDKASGTAQVMIERVGGNQRPVTVEYNTQDGTALAGTDYATAGGKLMFYGGLMKLPVKVTLIDDGVPATEPRYFDIALSQLLGDDGCTFQQATTRVYLTNSAQNKAPNLATQLYDPQAVDLSDNVTDAEGAANQNTGPAEGVQETIPEVESVYSQLTFGGVEGEISPMVYAGSLADIAFENPRDAWDGATNPSNRDYWSQDANAIANPKISQLYQGGETAKNVGYDWNWTYDEFIDNGVALVSTTETGARLTDAGWGAMGGTADEAGQMYRGYNLVLKTSQGHDTAGSSGGHYYYSYTRPRLHLDQGSNSLVSNPRHIIRFGASALNNYWTIRASDTTQNPPIQERFSNPFDGTYKDNNGFGFNGKVNLYMTMHYESNEPWERDEQNTSSMVWLRQASLYRRTFSANAFKVEITTPNDSNTAPADCAVLSDGNYKGFLPKVEILPGKGGVTPSNQVYVGSTIKISVGTAPAGYHAGSLVVYRKPNNGGNWEIFNKFAPSYNAGEQAFSIRLIGSNGNLDAGDLNAQFKFRVGFERTSAVHVDFATSVPKKPGEAIEIDKNRIMEAITGYAPEFSDHAFNQNVPTTITYGKSVFSPQGGDYSTTCVTETLNKPTAQSELADTVWTFNATNIQWVNFNLSPQDLLLVNGTPYQGNARIYLKESDFAGGLSVVYYHEKYLDALSTMKTTISWMEVYWDANGNGKIDGNYNVSNSTFDLTPVNGVKDESCGNIGAGTANETMFAPKKNKDGNYCQFFIKVCYTMIPRSMVVPAGASVSERAQILPAFITAVNADSAAYSKLTPEQRAYRYLVSGITKQAPGAADTRSSDDHLKYGADAGLKSTLDIPLGGDINPPTLANGAKAYTWTPEFRGSILYPFAAPDPITIDNSIAGPTEVTKDYTLARAEGIVTGYTYTKAGLAQMNGYLSSFTGTTAFAMVTQEQSYTTQQILEKMRPGVRLGGGAANVSDDMLYVQEVKDYSVKPDSVTLGGHSTTPDAEYLKEIEAGSAPGPESKLGMEDSGSEMSEFNTDLGMNLGSTSLPVTDYVSILLDATKVGFSLSLPCGELGPKKGEGQTFEEKNKGNWTQFNDFFKKGNFGGDESYEKASKEKTRRKNAPSAAPSTSQAPVTSGAPAPAPSGSSSPDNSEFKSKSFSVSFVVGLAFLFEYNSLDNDYHFEGMTISVSASLTFRIQARLTICPIVYFYFQFDGSIELSSGLGVIRDSVEVTPAKLDGKSANMQAKQVKLTHMTRPSAGAVLTKAQYDALQTEDAKAPYKPGEGGNYFNEAAYGTYAAARSAHLETGDYFLTQAQYDLLTAQEKESYQWETNSSTSGGNWFNKTKYDSNVKALDAYDKATAYSFETTYKAFNIRFSGKIAVDVYTKQGEEWKPAPESQEYITGFLSSEGDGDTRVVLKKQDGMELGETVKVVIRPLDYDEKVQKDVTTILYVAEIKAVRNEVYWKGIRIAPSVAIEVGAGIGVELMKVELYAKVGLEATFTLGVYNRAYDRTDTDLTNDDKYLPAEVEQFGFSIGIGLRVVLLCFTFELDAATYCVDYSRNSLSKGEWTTGWHFLNDWVDAEDASESGYLGVSIRAPRSAADRQKFYAPQDNAVPELSTQAYDPTDPNVPFQFSGFGTNVDAAKLGTDILSGSEYKVVSAGDRNFIVYTISRSGIDVAPEDSTQLVMSELARAAVAESGKTVYKYGLVNPVDAANATKHIVLDGDETGDLDFDLWTEESTSGTTTTHTIHSAWVSYAAKATLRPLPPKPTGEPYRVDGTVDGAQMTADNYNNKVTIPEPSDPLMPTPPPVVEENDHYTTAEITKEAYDLLDAPAKALCEGIEPADPVTGFANYKKYTLQSPHTTITEAKAAYAFAQANYDTGYATYLEDKQVYDAAVALKARYTEWYNYYAALTNHNAYVQQQVKAAARNTVLKSAAWSYTSTPAATEGEKPAIVNDLEFTTPVELGGDGKTPDAIGYVFSPSSNGNGSAVFFGSTATQDDGDAAFTKFKENVVAMRPPLPGNQPGKKSDYEDYLTSMKKSNLDVFGTQSSLNLSYLNSSGARAVSTEPLVAGQTLANVEFTQLDAGDTYYVAYTTQQDAYEGTDNASADHITVTRLFLRTVTVAGDNATWGTPYLLRMTRDYDRFSANDGVYKTVNDTTPSKQHDAPYFSNLSFLTANLDATKLTGEEEVFTTMDATPHTFLLFEMNGATYIILDDDLKSIVGTEHKGKIHPFFKGATQTSADGKTTKEEASGKLEVTIGTDKQGGIFAVYVGSVPNTTNNALYRSAYDPNSNTWGDGVMLAMRHMDTYEASIRNAWGKRTTQAAYWGLASELNSDGTQKGLLTEADVTNLFKQDQLAGDLTDSEGHSDTTAADIWENLDKAGVENLGDKKNLVFSNVQAIQGSGNELLVLTQATMTELRIKLYEKTVKFYHKETDSFTQEKVTDYSVIPVTSQAEGMVSDLGMYAISYGGGEQQLGEGKLSFGEPAFSMGSKLYVNLSVVNTGDTAFRGSVNQPITATLKAAGQTLAIWKVTSNVRSGQTLAMDGSCEALIGDLQAGDKFTLELKEFEGAAGGGTAYPNPTTKTIDLFTIEATSDLGVEDLNVSVGEVSADGRTTTLNIDFVAGNRGSGKALGVYTQFTYADGKDASGAPTYKVLDLRGSHLTIAQEADLKPLTASVNTDTNLRNGILYLYNSKDGNNDLSAGRGRKVSGTIQVPSAAFTAGESGYLDLKLTLFTGSDQIKGMDTGVISAKSSEYYGGNNTQNKTVQASTGYTVAPSIVIPMGTTTLVPITAVSTRGVKPALSVTEIDDTADGLNLGILNFKQSSADGGKVAGTLSITPSSQGTGIIHVYDGNTESLTAVAFTVTDSTDGIDIFNDNGSFSFKNADGSPYNAQEPSTQTWHFVGAPTWGGTGSQKEVPLRSNLATGTTNSSFTFNTVAEKIDLFFQGEVAVSSSFPNYRPTTFTNALGGSKPQTIEFGSNPTNDAFSVTVRVAGVEGRFDRMIEHYTGGKVPTPSYDGESPVFIWSRSLPATASINSTSPTPISLSLYVLDNAGIDHLEVDGKRYDTADSGKITNLDGAGLLWRYDFAPLSANKNYELKAVDTAGNTVSTTLQVDWFHAKPSGAANTKAVPLYDANFYLNEAPWNGSAIGATDVGKLKITFAEAVGNTKKTGNTHELYSFDGKAFTQLSAESGTPQTFKIGKNGIFQTRTVNTDGSWSSQVLYMGKMDGSAPQVSLGFDQANNRLSWNAYKPVTAATAISHADINGYTVSSTPGKNLNGTLPVKFGGKYTLSVHDEGGNSATADFIVPAQPINLASCTYTPTAAWNQAKNNGSLAVDLTGITGGTYHAADSEAATNAYNARYELTLVRGDYDLAQQATDPDLVWTEINKTLHTKSYPNLAAGAYLVLVRDMEAKTNCQRAPVTVADLAMTASGATINASLPNAKDGQLMATATGGNTTGFEFSILPVKTADDKQQYTIADFNAAVGKDPIQWSLGDNISLSPRSNTFTGLEKGWYLVAVRGLYGVSDGSFAALVTLRETLAAKELALASTLNPSKEVLAALEQAVIDAQAAYDLAATPVQTTSATAYTNTPDYWSGAFVFALEMDADPAPVIVPGSSSSIKSNLGKLSSNANGSTVYTLKTPNGKLTPNDSKALAAANQKNDVVIQAAGLSIFLPKGALPKDFDMNRLIPDLSAAKSGKMLQLTAANGQKVLVPWCLISDGSLKYMVTEPGDYRLVDCSAPFSDITGLWGADAIAFMSDRGILTGTGEKVFSPYLSMTRAMFVTALWRIAGEPAVKQEQSFSDLSEDWYRAAVQWAVKNGITNGCGENLFGTAQEVSREQMCTFLCRFLTYMDMELDMAAEETPFTDAGSINDWAKDAVAQCAKSGLVEGVGENTFAPTDSANRMEVSALFTRFITKLIEKYCGK